MAENVYEGMFILDSNRYGRNPEAVSGRIAEMIREAGGEMLVSRLWEERRLAYPIKGHRRATYWLTYFRLGGGRLADIERQCQLNDNILRTLLLKVDPRIVDTLVTHAQAIPGAAGTDQDKETSAPEGAKSGESEAGGSKSEKEPEQAAATTADDQPESGASPAES